MKRRILLTLIIASLLVTATASRAVTTTPQQAPPRESVVSIPFELATRHIMLKVKVGDAPLSFVLDTGDKYAVINLERAKQLGLKLEGQVHVGGAGPETQVGAFVRESSFTIPGLAGFSQPLNLALPIGGMASRLGQDFDGIIGSEFIKEFVVEVDYQARVIKLHDRDKFVYSGPGQSIAVHVNSAGHPILEAEVTPMGGEPVKGKFVLDIGSGAALALHSPFVTERGLLHPNLKTIKVMGMGGAGGKVTGRIGRVSELKIGNFKINAPITMFAEDKAGALANTELLGNIGMQIASKFRLFLDYKRDRIIFEPNDSFPKPYDRAYAGIALQAEAPNYRTFRIDDILENSPASEVGLQKNDVITEVNGKPAASLTLSSLNEMLERPVTHKLTIQRGEQKLKITLTPRRLV
jgi:hypothetical protein